jgi:glycerol kinase
MTIIAQIGIILLGTFPILALIVKTLNKPLTKLGQKLGMDATGAAGIVITLANSIPVYKMMKERMENYYLGIDQGTTGTTSLIFNEKWQICAKGYTEHRQYYPQPGWVEHNPLEIWDKTKESVAQALAAAGLRATDLRAIGMDNQGETCMAWDKISGEPVYQAIVWQDRRTARAADKLKEAYGDMITRKTGVQVDAYFSALKIKWILENVENAIKTTYGTGCFMLMNTGTKPVPSQHGLITTAVWGINNQITFALDGGVYIAGAAVQWLRDGLQIIKTPAETEALAGSVPDTGDVYFVPAFVGLAAPYWDQYARGILIGITGGTTRAHLVRATLESIAYQVAENLTVMRKDSGLDIDVMRVDDYKYTFTLIHSKSTAPDYV